MVTTGAMAFRSRTMTQARVSTPVTAMALRGSPLLMRAIWSENGTMRFWPMAIRMRGPPTSPASADEAVAPSRPSSTRGGKKDLSMTWV